MPSVWVELPEWLVAPVSAVFADLRGDDPIPDLWVLAMEIGDADGMLLGVLNPMGQGEAAVSASGSARSATPSSRS